MIDPLDEFYTPSSSESPRGHYHYALYLDLCPDLQLQALEQAVPSMTKGWYELLQLSNEERIALLRDYWMTTLPFHAKLHAFLEKFFSKIVEIRFYLIQKQPEEAFDVQIVYKDVHGQFFRGNTPASQNDIIDLKSHITEWIPPEDYVRFLKIHNGFSKGADSGLFSISQLKVNYKVFHEMAFCESTPILDINQTEIDPSGLIPFYQSYNMNCYQCFCTDWYPSGGMGNIYYSGITHSLASEHHPKPSPEFLAFENFSEWLIFYLEDSL
ncbi:MAG: SMI1/KNR4 family protein [Chlamydiia bacterium]|nr:SMI1/KNR4 family protein [Chlamydiia bacterium]